MGLVGSITRNNTYITLRRASCPSQSSKVLYCAGREKLKQDGVNIADWLTALALFTGHAAKAWPGVDVAALAQYLAHTLRAGQAFDLLLLKELVSVMTVRATRDRRTAACQSEAVPASHVRRPRSVTCCHAILHRCIARDSCCTAL